MVFECYVIQAGVPNGRTLGFLRKKRDFEMDHIAFTFEFCDAIWFRTEEGAREYFKKLRTQLNFEVFKVTIEKMGD